MTDFELVCNGVKVCEDFFDKVYSTRLNLKSGPSIQPWGIFYRFVSYLWSWSIWWYWDIELSATISEKRDSDGSSGFLVPGKPIMFKRNDSKSIFSTLQDLDLTDYRLHGSNPRVGSILEFLSRHTNLPHNLTIDYRVDIYQKYRYHPYLTHKPYYITIEGYQKLPRVVNIFD
jgi:hypothetical protein